MAEDFLKSYERHRQALAEANVINKATVFDALHQANIMRVSVDFDGEGDSGQINTITASSGDGESTIPDLVVPMLSSQWGANTRRSDQPLRDAIETLCYDYLEQEHGGWENNDGAYGEFQFDVAERTIELEFSSRYTDVHISYNSF